VKLLLDENLSDRVVLQILDLYPGSIHVKSHGLIHSGDIQIWSFAQQHGYTIVSKDADFHQRSLLFGHPPKLVFLRVRTAA
jgi:predicted nuclease of predicted toxin-antitoxin system